MWLTRTTLIEYVWKEYDRFWTPEDLNYLIKKRIIKIYKLGTKTIFRKKEVEEYFEEQRRRNPSNIIFHGQRRRTYR